MSSKAGAFHQIIKVVRMFFDLLALAFYQIAMALLVGLMFLTTVDVIGRFFGHAVLGSYQISELAQVWVLCLAWPLSLRLKTHVKVEFFASRLPNKMAKVIEFISQFLILGVFLILTWQGFKNVILSKEIGDFVSIVEIPLYPFKFAVPVGAFISCTIIIFAIISSLTKKRSNGGREL